MDAQAAAELAAFKLFQKWDIPRPQSTEIILEVFAPLIAEEGHDADSYFDKCRHQKAQIEEMEKRIAYLREMGLRRAKLHCDAITFLMEDIEFYVNRIRVLERQVEAQKSA